MMNNSEAVTAANRALDRANAAIRFAKTDQPNIALQDIASAIGNLAIAVRELATQSTE